MGSARFPFLRSLLWAAFSYCDYYWARLGRWWSALAIRPQSVLADYPEDHEDGQ